MDYSKIEIQNKIEELASLLTSPEDIAKILEVDEKEFFNELKTKGSDVYRAFYRGFMQIEMQIKRDSINPVDVDAAEFNLKSITNFKSKLIIQLDG